MPRQPAPSRTAGVGERQFPERVDVSDPAMKAIGLAAQAPAYVYERPLAVLNTLTGSNPATGQKGVVEQAGDTLMGVPVVGDLLRGAGNVLDASSKLFAGANNSLPASVLRDLYGQPNSAPAPMWAVQMAKQAGPFSGFDPFVEFLRGDKPREEWTVGDIRQYLKTRGFTPEDERDLAEGKTSPWGYGDRQVHPNPLIDLGTRLVVDPLNATVIAGPARVASAATKLPGVVGVAQGADRLMRLAEARAIVKGIPALAQPARSAAAGVAALRVGVTEGVTHRSFGLFLMGMGRGGSALLNTYRKAAIGTTVAQIGVNAVDDVLADKSGVPGPINDLFVLGRAIAEDRPLSEGMLFNLWAITHFPVRDMVGAVRDSAKGKVRYWWKTGADIEAKMVQLLEGKRGGTYAEQRARMVERFGGAEGWLDYLAMVSVKSRAGRIAAAFRERPVVRSMIEAQQHARLMNEMAWDEVRIDPVSGREVVDATVDWATSARRVKDFEGGLRNTFNPDRFYDEWTAWRAVAQQTSAIGQGAAVPKLNTVLIKEDIAGATARFERVAKNGKVSPDDAIRILNNNPALMVDEKTGGMWARLIVRDHEPVDIKWIRQRLDDVYERAISQREALAPAEQWENRAAREAAHRAGLVRSDGTLDFDRLPTDSNVMTLVPTTNDLGRRNAGFPARTLDDVAAMRSDPVIAEVIDPDSIRVLDESGYGVSMVKLATAGEDGALAPAVSMSMDPNMNPQSVAEVAALTLERANSRGHARLLYVGQAIDRHGLTANAAEFKWAVGPQDPNLVREAVDTLNRLFDETYIDDTAGVYRIIIPDSADAARLLPRITEANRALGELFPSKAVGGVFEAQHQRAWTQTIRNTAQGNRRGRAARAAGTERSLDAVRRDAELSSNWHAARQGYAERDTGMVQRVATQPGPDAGPVRATAPTGVVGDGAGGTGRGVAPRRVPDSELVTDPTELPDIADYLPDEPDGFYHVTTARDAVMREGLRPRAQTGTAGLGGGWNNQAPNKVSITYSSGAAALIEERITLAVKAARGEATVDEIVNHFSDYGAYGGDATGMARALGRQIDDPEDFDALNAIVSDYQGREYELVQKLDDGLTGYFDQPDGTVRVGLTGTQEQMARVDPNQIATLRVGVRRGANHDLVPDEMELRYAADDLDVLDDLGDGVAPDTIPAPEPVPPGVPAEGVRWLQDRDAEVTQFVPNYDASLTDRFSPEELVPFAQLQEDLVRHNPTYRIGSTPKGGTPYELGQGKAYQDIAAVRQMAGDAMTYKVMSKTANLWHAMFGRVYSKQLSDDAKQELMSDLVMADASPAEVNHFMHALGTVADNSQSPFPNVPLYQRFDLLPPETIDKIAHGIPEINGFKGFSPETLKKLGPHGASQAVRRSSSRFYRKLEQNHRLGSGKGTLGKLLDYTYGPATAAMNGTVGKGTGMIRTWYPIFRFVSDLRWHVMNAAEHKIIGAVRYGIGDVGQAGLSKRTLRSVERTPKSPLDIQVFKTSSRDVADDLAEDALASGWLDHRKLEGVIGPAFDSERIATTRKALETLANDDPVMVTMRKRYGNDATPEQLVDELDRMMYDFDVQGVPKTITDAAMNILDDAEYEAMRPFIQQLTRMHERNFRDVVHSFRGNTNRSNMERLANSYFLYWPISYQLKVGKVLFDTLTYRSFGRQTDLLGAWTIDRLMKEHTARLVDDPDYRQTFEDNPELWRAAGMFLPITPMDIGVSASRFTRYVGSALGAYLNLWPMDPSYPDLTTAEGAFEFSSRIMQMGPLYTADLLARAARELRE